MQDKPEVERLLAETEWLRRLARSLVAGRDVERRSRVIGPAIGGTRAL